LLKMQTECIAISQSILDEKSVAISLAIMKSIAINIAINTLNYLILTTMHCFP